jgi:predicted ArsR family transcriptional regulator
MIDGRGLHMVERKLKTRKKIKEFIEDNPEALKKDICKAIGITPMTLRTHLHAMSAQ